VKRGGTDFVTGISPIEGTTILQRVPMRDNGTGRAPVFCVILGGLPTSALKRGDCQMAKSGKKGKKKVETVFLVCEETGDYNYTARRKPGGEKLALKKYSPRLRRHTIHKEKKK
jgi:large subunit ribosomal protein L33